MPTGSPINKDTGFYCTKEDVLRQTRGEDTNLTDDDIEELIADKTRVIEKKVNTAWRPLKVLEYKDVTPTSEQMYETRNRRGRNRTNTNIGIGSVSRDRYIDVRLSNDRIRSINKLVTVTDDGTKDITDDEDDLWRMTDAYAKKGIIQINQVAFNRTFSGKLGTNLFEGASIDIEYEYGREDTNKEIKEACAKMVAYELINSDAFGNIQPDTTNFISPDEFIDNIKNDIENILDDFR